MVSHIEHGVKVPFPRFLVALLPYSVPPLLAFEEYWALSRTANMYGTRTPSRKLRLARSLRPRLREFLTCDSNERACCRSCAQPVLPVVDAMVGGGLDKTSRRS